MKCNLLIAAQSVVTDKASSLLSVFNIYQDVQSPQFPFVMPMAILISTEKENGDDSSITINLKIKMGTNDLLNFPVSLSFLDNTKRNNTVVNLQGLLIPQEGIIEFIILVGETIFKESQMTVQRKQQ